MSLTVSLDSVRWIRDHQQRLAVCEQPGHGFRADGVPAQHTVLAAEPQIAKPGNRVLGQRRRGIGFLVVLGRHKQSVDFSGIESGEGKVEIGLRMSHDNIHFSQM